MLKAHQVTGDIQIDISSIPDHVRDTFVAPLPQIVSEFFTLPGVNEEYQEWLKEYKKEKQAKREERKINETRKIPTGISN